MNYIGSLSGVYLTGGQVDAKINTFSGTLNTLARANLTCSQNQLPQFSGGAWTCGTIAAVAETEPKWTAASGNYYTKTDMANSTLTTAGLIAKGDSVVASGNYSTAMGHYTLA
jgi:hypothetical protein